MTIRIPKWGLGVIAVIAIVLAGALGAILGGGGDDRQIVVTQATEHSSEATGGDAETTDSTSDLQSENDCDELGINFQEQKEGACDDDGTTLHVVNRDTTLQLPELSARLVDIELTDAVGGEYTSEAADGTFAVFTLEIKNKLHAPMEFDQFQEQVSLSINENVFTQDFDAANGPLESSFLWIGEAIQPQATQTGSVVFDLPKSVAKKVETDGNLMIVNFSDADSYGEGTQEPLGIIRTYPPRE